MNCAYHDDVESVGFCVNCGRALCGSCQRVVEGSIYCQACLADFIQNRGTSEQVPSAGGDNPGAAFALGLIPGVGAIYNGEIVKAIVHVLIFGFLVALADMSGRSVFEVLFVLVAIGFYAYMPFEAYYTAKKRKLRNEGIDLETPIDRFHEQLEGVENRELWVGVGLVALGLLFFVNNFVSLPLGAVLRFWPALLIAAGVYLVLTFRDGRKEAQKSRENPDRRD